MTKKPIKVAIVHDWLIGGGAEKVVLELHHMFPDAPIYTSYCTPEWRKRLNNKVVTGFLQHAPFPAIRKFIPFLRILWFTNLKIRGYDLIISSSGAEAKGVKAPSDTPHIAYIHAPTHYYWSRYDEYLKNPGFGPFDWLARIGLKILVRPLRKWDYRAAQRPDYLLANSTHTQAGITRYYNRKSEVVFPPVELARFKNAPVITKRHGFAVTSRLTPYKRVDLAVQACTQLNLPLTIIGDGPEKERLQKLAGPTVTFLGRAPDEEVVKTLASARAFIFSGVDDFGIAPIEALAAGTPVIAYKAAGALDYVSPQTGLFFEEQTVESLVEALKSFDDSNYSAKEIKKASTAFSEQEFRKKIHEVIEKVL